MGKDRGLTKKPRERDIFALFAVVFGLAIGLLGCSSDTVIIFGPEGAAVSGSGAVFEDSTLVIDRAGTYVLSGELMNGRIVVDANKGADVCLVLSGLKLSGEKGPLIDAPKSGAVALVLKEGTENFVVSADAENAAIFVKKDLSISGGGLLTIKAAGDGVYTKGVLNILDGNLDITTGGGRANVPVRADDYLNLLERLAQGTPNPYYQPKKNKETLSMKALKGLESVSIQGGNIVIDAEDDGIHSHGDIHIASGALTIQSGDDGIHADKTLEITGGIIDVTGSYEGIEGSTVTISGGDISVVSDDDAISAGLACRITGGNIELLAQRDGIDSNGDIFIEGGLLKISAPSLGDECAFDFDGMMLVSGGEFITAGSVQRPSADSAQPVILVSYAGRLVAGSLITIKDSAGNTLLEHRSKIVFSASGFTSASFKLGETYSLYVDDVKKTDITLESVITTTFDDGRAYRDPELPLGF